MNYIQLINAFWSRAESDNLKGNDISVYFSLLKYCNKLNWLNPFVCHWDIVCQYAKVSKNSYYKSVETLSSKGYIKYEKGKKNQLKPKIVILQLENKEGIIKEQNGEQHKEQNGEQKGNLYKLLNNKTIKLINNNAPLVNSNLEKWINSENNESENKEGIEQSFETFWNLYDKKVDRKKSFDKWKRLKESERDEIIKKTPEYIKHHSEIKYRKNPVTFLNNRSWEDEIKTESQTVEDNQFFYVNGVKKLRVY